MRATPPASKCSAGLNLEQAPFQGLPRPTLLSVRDQVCSGGMALAVCCGSSEDRRKEAGVSGGTGRVQPQGAYGQPSEVDAVFSVRITWSFCPGLF